MLIFQSYGKLLLQSVSNFKINMACGAVGAHSKALCILTRFPGTNFESTEVGFNTNSSQCAYHGEKGVLFCVTKVHFMFRVWGKFTLVCHAWARSALLFSLPPLSQSSEVGRVCCEDLRSANAL